MVTLGIPYGALSLGRVGSTNKYFYFILYSDYPSEIY